jgi:hypothetical protein
MKWFIISVNYHVIKQLLFLVELYTNRMNMYLVQTVVLTGRTPHDTVDVRTYITCITLLPPSIFFK